MIMVHTFLNNLTIINQLVQQYRITCGFKYILKYIQRLSKSENIQIIAILKPGFFLGVGDKININISLHAS